MPAGQKVFTGGAFWWRNFPSGTGSPNLALASSSPTLDGNGWYADGINAMPDTWNLRVIARCLPAGRLEEVKRRKESVNIPAGETVDRRVSCPDDTRIIGGGAFWHARDEAPDPAAAGLGKLASSAPISARTWYAAGFHSGPGNQRRGFTVVVRCLASDRLSPYKRREEETNMPSGASWASGLRCGGSNRVGPSGVYFHKRAKPPKPSLGDDTVLTTLGTAVDPALYVSGGANVGDASLVMESIAFCLSP